MNHLYTMSAPGSTCSGLSWSYDQWGNRTAQTVTGGTCGSSQLTFNSSNHVTNPGFQYDAAGNLVNDGVRSYTYDAENRVTQVDSGATAKYTYDPLGYRVEKIAGGVTTEYVYDPEGHVAVDANWTCGQSCWNAAYFYLNGSAIAEYTSSSTEFISGDHLGSMRLLTNVSGGVVDSMDYLPFGEQIAGASGTTHKFTGYERDAESGLDNAQARYNSSTLGRFMSPDPVGNFVADATNPQTWNMYAYVNNSPLIWTDPTGLDYGCNDSWDNPCGGFGGMGGGYQNVSGGSGTASGGPPIIVTTVCGLLCLGDLSTPPPDPSGCSPFCSPVPPVAGGGGGSGGSGTPSTPLPQPPQDKNVCASKVLSAVNKQFGPGPYGVQGNPFAYPPGGTFNLNFTGNNLPAAQFNATQPGRYPLNWWTYLVGYGPTLHVVGAPGAFDPLAQPFSNSNVGGITSVSFTAHIDSAFAYNPIGLLFHFLKDLLGVGGRNQCPG